MNETIGLLKSNLKQSEEWKINLKGKNLPDREHVILALYTDT